MLAVCIPVYNQKVGRLVNDLITQSENIDENISIVLIDDASSKEFQEQYIKLGAFAKVIQLDANIGRSKIRNAFLKHTEAQFLLFLDCDSEIIHSDFLSKYVIDKK